MTAGHDNANTPTVTLVNPLRPAMNRSSPAPRTASTTLAIPVITNAPPTRMASTVIVMPGQTAAITPATNQASATVRDHIGVGDESAATNSMRPVRTSPPATSHARTVRDRNGSAVSTAPRTTAATPSTDVTRHEGWNIGASSDHFDIVGVLIRSARLAGEATGPCDRGA